jgi:hypothetical protein
MRNHRDEAFIPGNCPALRKGEKPLADTSRGFVVHPFNIVVDIESLNAEGDTVEKADPERASTDVYMYVGLVPPEEGDVHAYVMKETYVSTDPGIVLPDLIDDDPKAEAKIGGLVCERLKKCQSPVEYNGEVVCQGLHPAEIRADIQQLFSE